MNDPIDEERMLREGLQTPGLSVQAMQRIRGAVQREWRLTARSKPRLGGRRWLAAAAAAILAIAMGWGIADRTWLASPGVQVGHIVAIAAPGLVEVEGFRRSSALVSGSAVRAGQKIAAFADARVNLDAGGDLRIAKGTHLEMVGPDAIHLRSGELYVDIPPGVRPGGELHIVTDAGEFRHVGTQFSVAVIADKTRLRVREGQVLWQAAGTGDPALTVSAGTEMFVDARGGASRKPIATAGKDWVWVESLSAEMDIEDRPLIEYLEWYARETGRRLQIDDRTRAMAAGIRMHGNLRGIPLAEALSAVMSTTSLVYELRDGALRVREASSQ
ncbi:MAG: FecR domain-containing protein [Steroidobacteraceae bacterium]